MERKTLGLCLLLTCLGGIYAYQFTDWFAKKAIQVSVSFRPLRQAGPGEALPVVFGLDGDLVLKSIVVSELDSTDTNKVLKPVWRLESAGNQTPIRGFLYGDIPEGFRVPKDGAAAQALESGKSYRVDLQSRSASGSTVFVARGAE